MHSRVGARACGAFRDESLGPSSAESALCVHCIAWAWLSHFSHARFDARKLVLVQKELLVTQMRGCDLLGLGCPKSGADLI